MSNTSRADFQDDSGWLTMEYDRRYGYFSMAADHYHPQYELYYLISGERIYFIKDRSYRIRAGDLVFVDRNSVHKTLDSGRADHERLVLYLHPELFTQMDVPSDLTQTIMEPFNWDIPILRLPSPYSEAAGRIVQDMVEEMLHLQPGRSQLLRQRLVDLLVLACRNHTRGQVTPSDIEPDLHPTLQAVLRYLNENYRESLQLPDVAASFDISPYYLSRLFKKTTGFTFSDYMNLLRIKEAQRLLRESDIPITDIAWQAGFGNFSHFGKMFKRTVHTSPRQYRQQYKQKR
ncbi:AraC family transcriptional regulator [Paenibacillus lemnae]|uniref:AraC family transcriptional regulator n=1 Tax=Paenibacillus lemnae TaxID=1330551 RepID=A0A848MAG3_PAELE|nr:AraC family transcriptional regulator [Paenibacillus lemnae]NMO97249.1 AraC family transcriptional regulator [Paenibacillus lemnae]